MRGALPRESLRFCRCTEGRRRRSCENGATTRVPRCKHSSPLLVSQPMRHGSEEGAVTEEGGSRPRVGNRGVIASQPVAPPGLSVSASGAATPTLVHEGGFEREASTAHDARRSCRRGRRKFVGSEE
jgi:hypothetical protein